MTINRVFNVMFLFIILFSCKKEVVILIDEPEIIISDQDVPEISYFRFISSHRQECHDNSITLAETYSAEIEYKFLTGIQENSNYFYPIEKRFKTRFVSQTGMDSSYSNSSEWQNTQMFYRYSFNENKSFLYNSMTDSDPQLLFDFNVKEGDLVNLALNIDSFDFTIEILSVSFELVNNINLPVVKCFWNSPMGSTWDSEFTISPLLPNPFAFESKDFHSELNWFADPPECNLTNDIEYFREAYSYVNEQYISKYWLNF